jgi:hypothetical protein
MGCNSNRVVRSNVLGLISVTVVFPADCWKLPYSVVRRVDKIRKKDGSARKQIYRQRVTGRIIKRSVVEVYIKRERP